MNETIRQLIKYKGFGAVLFSFEFKVIEINAKASALMECPATGNHSDILDYFPELIGNESTIQAVIKGKKTHFHLDFVNRNNDRGSLRYFDLLVLADENSADGLLIIQDVTEKAKMLQEINQQKYELLLYRSSGAFRRKFIGDQILGKSPAIEQVRETIGKLSKAPNATVLLLGETGTGKNLVARVIHYSSMSADAPFVEINCAALPENLIESELFGYEKGAFTHATVSRRGLLEEASGGTVFLDEIGDLPLHLQAKLLSVIETKKIRRLGSNKTITVNVRIITATNQDLDKKVNDHSFRKDLYYRLNVVKLYLPPLRALGDDVIIIAEHFLKLYNIDFNKKARGFTPLARRALQDYKWPGNVRELINCLERAMIFLESETVDITDMTLTKPDSAPDPLPGSALELDTTGLPWTIPPTGLSLEAVERQLIVLALNQTEDNQSEAARLLGLSRDTLRYRLKKHQLI